MAQCDYCGTRIFFGGVKDGQRRFCNQKCHQNGLLLSLASQVPLDVLQKQVDAIHEGRCPHCQGPGPVDVHTSYRVWSIVMLTTWSSRPRISCRSCGRKKQLGDLTISLLFGWWGMPWGLIFTPIQIGRDLHGIFRPPISSKPSSLLHRLVCLNIAKQVDQQGQPPPPTQTATQIVETDFRLQDVRQLREPISSIVINELSPPPLPAYRNEKTASSAIWSLSLACFVWIALLVLAGVVTLNKPADNDKVMWFVVGASCLILLAALLASIILAVTVLIKRRKGAILAIIALVLSALPFLLFAASAVRVTLKPSSF